jgi:hypothetical protein
MELTMKEKQALTGKQAPRYRQSDKKTKTKILDKFVQATGYNRKYALHILTHWGKETFLTGEGKPVKLKGGYDETAEGGREEAGLWATGHPVPPPYAGLLLVPVWSDLWSATSGPPYSGPDALLPGMGILRHYPGNQGKAPDHKPENPLSRGRLSTGP